jgi:hypothetical protein
LIFDEIKTHVSSEVSQQLDAFRREQSEMKDSMSRSLVSYSLKKFDDDQMDPVMLRESTISSNQFGTDSNQLTVELQKSMEFTDKVRQEVQ